MAVDKHPSRAPSLPRKPPRTSTTDGQINTVARTQTGDGTMEYGSRNGKNLQLKGGSGSERAHDFQSSDGKARSPGKKGGNGGAFSGKSPRPGSQSEE